MPEDRLLGRLRGRTREWQHVIADRAHDRGNGRRPLERVRANRTRRDAEHHDDRRTAGELTRRTPRVGGRPHEPANALHAPRDVQPP